MQIAFYAPMKSPNHPNPSGDRSFARLIVRALKKSGHEVTLASHFRSYDRYGHQWLEIAEKAKYARERAICKLTKTPPDVWFTYHLYHKAPDLIGPALSDYFGIPYVVADASYAAKQTSGPWGPGFAEAKSAILRANKLICFDPLDGAGLRHNLMCGHKLLMMAPFVRQRKITPPMRERARRRLSTALKLPVHIPWVVTVAMMREDIKAESYKLLAQCALKLRDQKWALLIAGDGTVRDKVEGWFEGFDNIRFLGTLFGSSLSELYAAGDFTAWPALKEGCSMALLEAAASGLPVLASKRPGLEQFIKNGVNGYLCQEGELTDFEYYFRLLLNDPHRCKKLGAESTHLLSKHHNLDTAATKLNWVLSQLQVGQ